METISPIRISSNGRYFEDAGGAPVFWLGDTQWELFRCFTPETAMPILRDRQAKGFNVILIMLTGVDHSHINPDAGKSFVNLNGDAPWMAHDPLRPNLRYFDHIDTMIRLGEQTGQVFVVGIYHQWHRELITLEKARPWARWVAERYRDVPNLIWSMYPRAESAYAAVCRELAAGLREGDQGAHLISVHPDPSVASSSFLHAEPWLAFNMIQTCVTYDQIYPAVMADYQLLPPKPVVMAEGGYEGLEFGKLQGAHEIRKQAYWTQLAGGYHVYGHNDAWTSPDSWREWLNAPGAQDLHRFRDILTAIDEWWMLVPDADLIVDGAGSGEKRNVAARSADNRWMLVYLSDPATVILRLPDRLARDGFSVQMINPAVGEWLAAQQYPAQTHLSLSTPPGWEDTLVLVKTHA